MEEDMVEIRKALPSDAEKILEYCKLIGGESDNLTFGPEGVPFSVEAEKEYLETLLHSDRQLYLLAVESGKIVGSASFAGQVKPRLAHRGELSISVRKEMWGKHIGTRLMEKIIRFAKNIDGLEILSLEVRSDNARAIALYKKFGFETIGTFPGFMKINGQDISCDIMMLRL